MWVHKLPYKVRKTVSVLPFLVTFFDCYLCHGMTLSRSQEFLPTHSWFIRARSFRCRTRQTRYNFISIMAPKTASVARRSDSENTPPTARLANAKSKVRGGIQGSSHRRRVRSAGGPHHPRYAVAHAKHKNIARHQPSLINIELPRTGAEIPDTTAAVSMSNVTLPRYLSRPSFCQIAKEAITSVAPELADTELNYIREGLQCLGPE
jgi:hypothetical protein